MTIQSRDDVEQRDASLSPPPTKKRRFESTTTSMYAIEEGLQTISLVDSPVSRQSSSELLHTILEERA